MCRPPIGTSRPKALPASASPSWGRFSLQSARNLRVKSHRVRGSIPGSLAWGFLQPLAVAPSPAATAFFEPYRSSSGWTHEYGVISCVSVSLIMCTGGA